MTMNATTEKKNDKKPANGEASAKGAPVVEQDDETEAKRRGAVPTMPMAAVYRHGGKVFAAIHHPIDKTSYIESGKGEGSAKGALEDSGYRLSGLLSNGPEWLLERVPEGAEIIGFATIKGFPLLPQTK